MPSEVGVLGYETGFCDPGLATSVSYTTQGWTLLSRPGKWSRWSQLDDPWELGEFSIWIYLIPQLTHPASISLPTVLNPFPLLCPSLLHSTYPFSSQFLPTEIIKPQDPSALPLTCKFCNLRVSTKYQCILSFSQFLLACRGQVRMFQRKILVTKGTGYTDDFLLKTVGLFTPTNVCD